MRHENKVINPKTKRPYAKPQSHSFLFDHQNEDHNGDPPNFTLQSKRYYGKDRLACQVAEGVSLKMRKGKILNSRLGCSVTHCPREKHPPRIMTTMACGHQNFLSSFHPNFHTFPFFNLQCQIKIKTCPVMFDKAKCAKHVTTIILNKIYNIEYIKYHILSVKNIVSPSS